MKTFIIIILIRNLTSSRLDDIFSEILLQPCPASKCHLLFLMTNLHLLLIAINIILEIIIMNITNSSPSLPVDIVNSFKPASLPRQP